MDSVSQTVWLGYSRVGGRFHLNKDQLKDGIVAVGPGFDNLAQLFAYACNEAGLRTLVLDISGRLSQNISGYVETYKLPYFLYDTIKLNENSSVHALLAASAYNCALDLSFEQESILNSKIRMILEEGGTVSPAAIGTLIIDNEGRAADRLKLRLEGLKTLDTVSEAGTVRKLLEKSALLDFSDAGSPEASETAVLLFLAKLLAITDSEASPRPEVVIIPESNRLFRERPIFRKNQRILSTFTSAPFGRVLLAGSMYGVERQFQDTCSIKVLSSAEWNQTGSGVVLTPNMLMYQNHPYGYAEAFIPREFEPKTGESKTLMDEQVDFEKLAKQILHEAVEFKDATRSSLIDYLSTDFERKQLENAFDWLQAGGYVTTRRSDSRGDSPSYPVVPTEKGFKLLEAGD
jgi:hypothetical protein